MKPRQTDRTFFTNDETGTLLDRFQATLKDARFFDVLVGYFRAGGFYQLHAALAPLDKVRILVGLGVDRESFRAVNSFHTQTTHDFKSSRNAREIYQKKLIDEIETTGEPDEKLEIGLKQFIRFVQTKCPDPEKDRAAGGNGRKLEMRVFPARNIHAKVYIGRFQPEDRQFGFVITGSSNFSYSGLVSNREFNVELKDRRDVEFALEQFEGLWAESVDISEEFIDAVRNKTWLTQHITPYRLYLKFLYEYFKDELNLTDDLYVKYWPQKFMKLAYKEQAVLNAKKILLEYGGVFISDVVGLGKTYISAMLAGQLDGRTLVIAPPVLLEEANPGSWKNVFSDFRVPADFQSLGKLDHLINRGVEKYKNIIIDEAHRFRTEATRTYEKLAEVTRGKRVILVTATPYNNSPKDILSLLKLFQKGKKSTIPNLPDLDAFFSGLEKKAARLDRKKDYDRYIKTVRANARVIRNKVLKYLMVRRTRTEIKTFFEQDIVASGLKFPEPQKPEPLFYQFNDDEDDIFSRTIGWIANDFRYARYMPMLYYTGKIDPLEAQSQRNMGRFMKILLIKRLESSFYAFRRSVDRFLRSYEMFIREFENGYVYVSAKHTHKIFELLESDDDEGLQRLLDEGKAERHSSADFHNNFINDLRYDYDLLCSIRKLWRNITRDPKLIKFIGEMSKNPILQRSHLVIFTESKETAEYLYENLNKRYPGTILLFTGNSSASTRDKVLENFDHSARHPKNDFRILVSTEVLSEGVNLHRANVVLNYDIPWNPTRMMQRVGRINRVDTPFDEIHTFNFFPTTQSDDQIKLKEAAEGKINAFLTLLGGDAALLTEGEPVKSHELFDRLISKKSLEGDDDAQESELKYLRQIQNIREREPGLFEKIKRLPKKARTAKYHKAHAGSLVTYFRQGKLQKFFLGRTGQISTELDFMTAAKILECPPGEEKKSFPESFYELLENNKEAFRSATGEEMQAPRKRGGQDSAARILKILKITSRNTQAYTEDQELYLQKVITQFEEGGLPKQTAKATLKALNSLKAEAANPLRVLAMLQTHISERLLKDHYAEQNATIKGAREVILSLYLAGE